MVIVVSCLEVGVRAPATGSKLHVVSVFGGGSTDHTTTLAQI